MRLWHCAWTLQQRRRHIDDRQRRATTSNDWQRQRSLHVPRLVDPSCERPCDDFIARCERACVVQNSGRARASSLHIHVRVHVHALALALALGNTEQVRAIYTCESVNVHQGKYPTEQQQQGCRNPRPQNSSVEHKNVPLDNADMSSQPM
jgi:hypothetical protein